MLNLHSHSRADLSRNHKVLDELTSLVEATERAAFTTDLSAETAQESVRILDASTVSQPSPEHPNDKEAREYRKKFPFGADLADNACRNLED